MLLYTICLLSSCKDYSAISLTRSLEYIAQVQQNPEQAQSICPRMSTENLRDQCWLATPVPTSLDRAVWRCNQLTQSLQSECFFNIAEKHNKKEFCKKSGQFETDCNTHILQQNCGKYLTIDALLKYTESLNLNVFELNVAGLVHRCLFFGKPQLDIRQCNHLPYTDSCRNLVISLFQTKMTDSIDCKQRTSRLSTFGDSDLEKLVTETLKSQCPSQEVLKR